MYSNTNSLFKGLNERANWKGQMKSSIKSLGNLEVIILKVLWLLNPRDNEFGNCLTSGWSFNIVTSALCDCGSHVVPLI